jgi:hypothetical protein
MASPKQITQIFAVDPGLISGVALFELTDAQNLQLLNSDELTWQDLGYYCESTFMGKPSGLAVVGERFTITKETAKNSQAPWSLQCLGMVQWLSYYYEVADYVLQSPADAKTMFPNPRLKTMGYWHKGGEGHALDAIRHGLLYAVKKARWRSPALLL